MRRLAGVSPAAGARGLHVHDVAELAWLAAGAGTCRTVSRAASVHPGQVVIVPAGIAHDIEPIGEADLHVAYCSDTMLVDGGGVLTVPTTTLMRELLRYLGDESLPSANWRRGVALLRDLVAE